MAIIPIIALWAFLTHLEKSCQISTLKDIIAEKEEEGFHKLSYYFPGFTLQCLIPIVNYLIPCEKIKIDDYSYYRITDEQKGKILELYYKKQRAKEERTKQEIIEEVITRIHKEGR